MTLYMKGNNPAIIAYFMSRPYRKLLVIWKHT